MNSTNAAKYLPLVQALAEGKTIQLLVKQGIKEFVWRDLNEIELMFCFPPEEYRVKPEAPPVHEGWINIFIDRHGPYSFMCGTTIYPTKGIADRHAELASTNTRIACIKISYSEGEGLMGT